MKKNFNKLICVLFFVIIGFNSYSQKNQITINDDTINVVRTIRTTDNYNIEIDLTIIGFGNYLQNNDTLKGANDIKTHIESIQNNIIPPDNIQNLYDNRRDIRVNLVNFINYHVQQNNVDTILINDIIFDSRFLNKL